MATDSAGLRTSNRHVHPLQFRIAGAILNSQASAIPSSLEVAALELDFAVRTAIHFAQGWSLDPVVVRSGAYAVVAAFHENEEAWALEIHGHSCPKERDIFEASTWLNSHPPA